MQKVVESGISSPKPSPLKNLNSLMKDKLKDIEEKGKSKDKFKVNLIEFLCS